MTVGVLLLAAGQSRRFGSDKLHALLPDGRDVLTSAVDMIRESGLPIVVARPTGATIDIPGTTSIVCRNASAGMGTTIAEAIITVPAWSSTIIALADMPFISSQTFVAVAELAAANRIVVPEYDGKRGHPVCFGANFYSSLAGLLGDTGAKALLHTFADATLVCPVEDAGILRDIDLPADLV